MAKKKTYKTKPTIKQRLALKNIAEKHCSLKQGMLDAGYSINTAVKPKNLTESKGWNEIMEEFLPDWKLGKKHFELLDKQEVITRNNNKSGKIEVIKTGEIDVVAVSKALDMAYKLKNKYDPSIKHKFEGVDTEELKERVAVLIAGNLGNTGGT